MKTITFYSYKGGVGRTLALMNIANRLAEFGKKVCIIDFDLEAPGLIHKYKREITKPIEKGIVDYIYDFAINNVVNESISDFSTTISLSNNSKDITFIPAGNSDSPEYWKKLSRINWWDMFYKDNSEGIPFFLDLKEKIENEFAPDYLLIDTRTGISEISGVTMNILADSIVILAVNNEENICGSKYIIDAISDENNNILDNKRDVHFVLSRIPLKDSVDGKMREEEIVGLIKKRILPTDDRASKITSFNVLHSDSELELDEMNTKGGLGSDFCQSNNKQDDKSSIKLSTISTEYLALFNSLVKEDLLEKEKTKLDNIEHVNDLLLRASENFNNPDSSKFIRIIEQIREIDSSNVDAFYIEGHHLYARGKTERAIQILEQGISDGDNKGECLFLLARIYFETGKYKEAIEKFHNYIKQEYQTFKAEASLWKVICKKHLNTNRELLLSELNSLIEKYPTMINALNSRSDTYCSLERYDEALIDIYKAIKLDPKQALYYATLAEIRFRMKDLPEFYRNLDVALSKGYKFTNVFKDTEYVQNIYKEAAKNPEFIKTLEMHNQLDAIAMMKEEEWI